MWLRKEKGGTSVGPYSWPKDGSVCETDDITGRALLAIDGAGYSEVPAPGPEAGEPPDGGGEAPAGKPARRKPAAPAQE